MITEFRSLRIKFVALSFGALLPFSPVQAGGWWNHKSVVAVPIGQPVGTVQGAAPYQIFTAPAAQQAITYAPAYSYAPAANYAVPQYSSAPMYGFTVPAPIQPQFTAPANGYQDLGKQIADAIRQGQASAAASSQSAASTSQLSADEIGQLRDLIKRQSAAPAQSAATPAAQAPQQAVQYVPVLVGYSQPTTTPQYTVPQQMFTAPAAATTMSLVPVQLYRQKNFLGMEKLKPVNVYPYGVR